MGQPLPLPEHPPSCAIFKGSPYTVNSVVACDCGVYPRDPIVYTVETKPMPGARVRKAGEL